MNQVLLLVFQLSVLLFSVIIHEVSHGTVALKLGDRTAKDAGRLTLNPLNHLDFFGSFILPLSLFLLSGGQFVLGWAKPVPYDPRNLKNPKSGSGLIGAAGPISNLLVAAVFGLALRLILPLAGFEVVETLIFLINYIVFINVLLAIFNLLPIPPLDGSGILFSLLPNNFNRLKEFLLRYGFFILIIFIFFGFQLLIPLVHWIYQAIVGPAAIF
ncbi:MAG: site-2 protease family protein [Patescibacteria group bacterium]